MSSQLELPFPEVSITEIVRIYSKINFASTNRLFIFKKVVPHVPPQAFGYLHPGVEAWARSSSNIRKYYLP
jgi:hypothetical protein